MLIRRPDIGFIPTPDEAIEVILDWAQMRDTDVVYDLGCGDGRTLIAAAKRYGARGVGIDIDAVRVEEATARAAAAGVSDRVSFRQADLFETDFSDATIVILYLLPHLNLRLRPTLWSQLKPGTQLFSIDFDMDDWQPEKTKLLDIEAETTVYFWKIPAAPMFLS